MAGPRYSILEKIDAGGMAEVWKARATSMEGFDKLVAIKRVLPNLSENQKFMSMFLDEARLALTLNHANVVQTFDIGVSDNSYFIVMEWIDGTQLKMVNEVARLDGYLIPKQQAVFIAAEICKALTHAHQRRDENGVELGIIHRDVSPPNVLLSREGEVKLADFGLAKAQSQITATDPGIVKGKFGYLSPEAASGDPVDLRADVFSTGIILWETLAGRRLFEGETNLETVKLVRAAHIPPLNTLNPDIDKELEIIIAKALAKNPDERYQTAEELGHALTYYLFSNRLMVTSYDIAVLVKRSLASRDQTRPMLAVTPEFAADAQQLQGELGGFVSLDELERQPFVSVSASYSQIDERTEHVDANPSLGAVDPRSWADEFELPTDVPAPKAPMTGGTDKTILGPPPTKNSVSTTSGHTELKMNDSVNHLSIPAPMVQRIDESVDEAGASVQTRTSLMEFSAPNMTTVTPSEPTRFDPTILIGVLGGLVGAAIIIGLTYSLTG
ncbi:MAG: serine/threonine-protein kinase [Myxococcota bacterium]|nr:serine/threonine-protein kinase [Myxococcota bacterium]